jgi:hypothetical protein
VGEGSGLGAESCDGERAWPSINHTILSEQPDCKLLCDAALAPVAERLSPFIGEEDRRDTDVGVGGCLLRSGLSFPIEAMHICLLIFSFH